MRSITPSVDEDVLAAARRCAIERGSPVSALVREFFAGIAEREDRARQARGRLRELGERSSARIGSASWARDDLPEA